MNLNVHIHTRMTFRHSCYKGIYYTFLVVATFIYLQHCHAVATLHQIPQYPRHTHTHTTQNAPDSQQLF